MTFNSTLKRLTEVRLVHHTMSQWKDTAIKDNIKTKRTIRSLEFTVEAISNKLGKHCPRLS